jgi:ABC-type phosphate/phosphonate transport system substrate-binding protein
MEQKRMNQSRQMAQEIWAVLAALGIFASPLLAEEATQSEPVKIGMVSSLFKEIPKPMIPVLMQPFASLMQQQTGVTGQICSAGEYTSLGQELATDKFQLGVFHGVEFAWARLKNPDLQPLMIAINQDRHLRAYLVVRSDMEGGCLNDLEGKILAIPKGTREHCLLFLDKHCRKCGHEPKEFFAQITTPPNPEDALDRVFDDEVQATVVDSPGLESYKRRKPGRFEQLQTLLISEKFPAGVVAFHPGALDGETLRRFREGMMNANKTALGRQLMTLWKLTAFEPVPSDYEQTLADIVAAYPPSEPVVKTTKALKK